MLAVRSMSTTLRGGVSMFERRQHVLIKTVARERHESRKHHFVMKPPPIMSQEKWKKLAEHHLKLQKKRKKIPWDEIFPGQKAPVFHRKRAKPDWRNFDIKTIAESARVAAYVPVFRRVAFVLDGTLRALFKLGLGVASLILAAVFIAYPTTLSGPSMLPTLNESGGDFVLVSRIRPLVRGYKVGDIVVARPPIEGSTKQVAKRIRAMEGDTVVLEDGSEYVLKKKQYWLQGDNPYRSIDSREYGPVPRKNLSGIVFFRLFPKPKLIGQDFEPATKEIDAAFDDDTMIRVAERNRYILFGIILLVVGPFAVRFVYRRYRRIRQGYRQFVDSGGEISTVN